MPKIFFRSFNTLVHLNIVLTKTKITWKTYDLEFLSFFKIEPVIYKYYLEKIENAYIIQWRNLILKQWTCNYYCNEIITGCSIPVALFQVKLSWVQDYMFSFVAETKQVSHNISNNENVYRIYNISFLTALFICSMGTLQAELVVGTI